MPNTPETTETLTPNTLRNVTSVGPWTYESTPIEPENQDPERFRLYRLCPCADCDGKGRVTKWGNIGGYDMEGIDGPHGRNFNRCKSCRGEGRTLDLVATCGSKEAVGVALVTLAQEDEWDECPFGLMDRPQGHTGRWLIKPWGPSPRNESDAGRVLAGASARKRTNPTR